MLAPCARDMGAPLCTRASRLYAALLCGDVWLACALSRNRGCSEAATSPEHFPLFLERNGSTPIILITALSCQRFMILHALRTGHPFGRFLTQDVARFAFSSLLPDGVSARDSFPMAGLVSPWRSVRPLSPSRAQDSETLNDGRPASAAQALDRPVADHRAGPFPQHAPFAPGNAQLFRPYQSSPASTHEEHLGPHGHRVPPRPNSQPMHISQQEQEYRQRQEAQNRGVFHGFRQYVEQPAMPPAAPQGAPRADAPGPLEGPQRQGEGVPHPQDRSSHGLFSPRSSHASLPRGGFAAPLREDYTGLFRPAFHPYGHPSQPMGPNGAKESPDFRGLHEAHPRADHRPSPSPSEAALIEARSRQPTGPQVPPGMALYDTATQDPNFRRTEEPRSAFLGISPESNRRNGRASPLPQAVQGAQLRSVGPPGAPGVKSEFGRMFPGIGSGVGSATPTAGVSANGTTTPSRMSPAGPGDVAEAEGAPVGDAEGVQLSRGGSRSGRRTKKAREDGGKMDSDSAEGRETPALSQRGNEHANFQTPYTITERPTKPVNVPLDADLHITVLILPPLEEYASTMRNNMRSRKWGGTHDGMSFMISSIDFVNEPKASRYSERTGAARRVRMREELERRKAAESLLGLLNGSSRMPVSV
ncbi:hypothetical protein M8818_001562 [Zalaria obscura]|uniref:Uncharacterized protein n=1 Tax=Zalaria obscura TaxID=2024903 RepID=A0ACC3SK39_9PEZI